MVGGAAIAVNFAILSVPRSGSNMLCGMLNSHPDILCHHELFHPNDIWYAFGCRDGAIDLGPIQDRNRSPLAFTERVWLADLGHRAVGFKMLRSQNRCALVHVLLARSVKKILLIRKNHLATYVSHETARRTRKYSATADGEAEREIGKVHVDVRRFKRYARRIDRHFSLLRAVLRLTRQQYLEVHYEHLLERKIKTRLLEYIGVAAEPELIHPVNKKQRRGRLADRMANVDMVFDQLRGSRYERELVG